jgi:hypothetical protein
MRVFSDHLHADDELIPKRLSKKLVVSSHCSDNTII